MSNQKRAHGEVYTVPVGVTVHCVQCSTKLEPGDECYIEDDSSSIYCVKHIPKPKTPAPHRAESRSLWMEYETERAPARIQRERMGE